MYLCATLCSHSFDALPEHGGGGQKHVSSETAAKATTVWGYLLRQPEVCHLDVPFRIKKDVLWLQVTIHDVQAVQVLQRQNELCTVQACAILAHFAAQVANVSGTAHSSAACIMQQREQQVTECGALGLSNLGEALVSFQPEEQFSTSGEVSDKVQLLGVL